MKSVKVKGIPSTEIIWVTRTLKNGNVYYITSKKIRDYYFLYQLVDGAAKKISKARCPLDFDKKIK